MRNSIKPCIVRKEAAGATCTRSHKPNPAQRDLTHLVIRPTDILLQSSLNKETKAYICLQKRVQIDSCMLEYPNIAWTSNCPRTVTT
ncbi:unnamed protein product [Brugia pahangi]|uniref:Uncharacterized protein n=1 Tax=Brugia pahangi TaxID=6280 RepID=A0A0N4T2D4_BRUPA|nr:unnamed protein product [Brugia pahangi]